MDKKLVVGRDVTLERKSCDGLAAEIARLGGRVVTGGVSRGL
jgi:hypothetical protein